MQKPFWFTWKLPVVGVAAAIVVTTQWPTAGSALLLLSVIVFPLIWLIGGRRWDKAHLITARETLVATQAAGQPMMTRNSKLRRCKDCGAGISKTAIKCPQCGGRNMGALQTVTGAIVAFGMVWFYFGGGLHQVVADDAIKQYHLAQEGGNQVEICVKAKLVAEAFNQGNDEENYLKWHDIAKSQCPAILN